MRAIEFKIVVPAMGVGVCVLIAAGSPFWLANLTLIAIYAIAVIGLNLLLGVAGQVSFAQPAFMAVGGYAVGLLTTRRDWPTALSLLAGVVIAAVASLAVAVPMLRLRGHYLAMGTFTLVLAATGLASAASFTNGNTGIAGVPDLRVGSVDLSSPRAFCVVVWLVLAASAVLFVWLRSSAIGRRWRAIASDERVAVSLGIRTVVYKAAAFALAASLGALSGGLHATYTSFVSPDLYGPSTVINVILMLFIGGVASTTGPIVGAGVVILTPQAFTGLERYTALLFNVLLLATLVLRPQGVFGNVRGLMPLGSILPGRRGKWSSRRLVPDPGSGELERIAEVNPA